MNKWKIAFFLLVIMIIGLVVGLFYWISTPSDSSEEQLETTNYSGNVLTVNSTKEDFEGIANTFMKKAVGRKTLPLKLELKDQVILTSEIIAFRSIIPVKMYFEPFVEENGDIRLVQSSLEIGIVKLPPETVLKVLKDSIQLPNWMIVKPSDKEVLIQLANIPMASGVHVRAKELNLAEDVITLEIVIPDE
ncbi:YpmS family protein [Psychrobacillus sp. L3]|uniref:YpmS family protein n=1 Tax=Psychrobacillus sp. L3 TaxID=3236891 RepID=UPI0036F1AF9F